MVNNKYNKKNLFCKVLFNIFVTYLLNKKLMSNLIREQIEKVRNFNTQQDNILNKNKLLKILDVISKIEVVTNVECDPTYNDDDTLRFKNTVIYVSFGKLKTYGVALRYSNNAYGYDATNEKMTNFLIKTNTNLNNKIQEIEEIKLNLIKIKKIMDIVDKLNIEKYDNISYYGYSLNNEKLMITFYQKDEIFDNR